MGQYALEELPLKGKLFDEKGTGHTGGPYRGGSSTPKKIGQPATSQYLTNRMKADDSVHVNMSDQKLGGGRRITGEKKRGKGNKLPG